MSHVAVVPVSYRKVSGVMELYDRHPTFRTALEAGNANERPLRMPLLCILA
jgi:hypothetical protein